MTMTLSGSGTIAGLVAGGLPDASVTAGDLASGAARTNFGAGAVLQVVQGTTSSSVTTTTVDSWVDTDVTATITPTSSNSKILVLVTQNLGVVSGSYNDKQFNLGVFRGSNLIFGRMGWDDFRVNTAEAYVLRTAISYLDSPSSVSALTYKTRMSLRSPSGGTLYAQYSGNPSAITLMEIAA